MRSFGLSAWLVFVIFFVLGSGAENIFGQEGKEEENNLIAQYLDIARKSSKDLIETMRDALLKELEKGDVLSAVSVCSELSQNIIKEKQQKYGFYIRRISEKYRNEKNKPDKYELSFLKKLEKLSKEGKLQDEYYEIVEEKDGKYLRYFKPILVQPMCLSCHGDLNSIPEDVRKFLKEKYPEDKAFGYKAGDFRGAVSVKIKLSPLISK
jgi:asparagine synthetase B (glutamine-hydrolysing)